MVIQTENGPKQYFAFRYRCRFAAISYKIVVCWELFFALRKVPSAFSCWVALSLRSFGHAPQSMPELLFPLRFYPSCVRFWTLPRPFSERRFSCGRSKKVHKKRKNTSP